VNLTALHKFSDSVKEDRLTAKEGLEKVTLNTNGGNWIKVQTLTHFRNILRGEMFAWYNSFTMLEATWA
jgi:hypothetical protein